jgi:hypothetical protein
MSNTHDDEQATTPYVTTLPDGKDGAAKDLVIPHETTLSAIGKDRAIERGEARGERGVTVEILRLALEPKEFARLEVLTDDQLFDLIDGWYKHCGLKPGESKASTS